MCMRVCHDLSLIRVARRSGFTKGVVGFGIDWNWMLGFSALTALKEQL